jgi:NitT/TauT family transport system substrate-binding protein
MKIKSSLLVLILALSFSLAACAPQPTPTPELTPVTVQLLWTHQAQFAGMYAADLKGFYAGEGLKVTFLEGGTDVPRWDSVLDGSAQFGLAGADEIILARSQGMPVRGVSVIYRRSPVVFITLADSGITRPEDFAGKQVRAPANTIPALHAITNRVGISPDQYIEVANLPSDLALFASGEVPIWGVYLTGFVVQAEQAGYKLNIIYPDDYGVHFYADSIFTTDDRITKNPDLALRFLRATLKGWTYAVENPAEVGDMVLHYNPAADPALEILKMTASLPLINTGEDHIGWMKPEVWAGMNQTLQEQGVVTGQLDINQVYTLQFLETIFP